jgi:glycosidase
VLGEHDGRAKLNTALQLTARGVPCIYYGEEIGMRQGRIPLRQSQDGVARHLRPLPSPLIKLGNRFTGGSVQRDGSRTPMQWNGEAHAGFTVPAARPWLPVNDDYPRVNRERQANDPDSLLSCYRRFLSCRRRFPALRRGTLSLLSRNELPKEAAGYLRMEGDELILILLNFSARQLRFALPSGCLEGIGGESGRGRKRVFRAECSTHTAAEGRTVTDEVVLLPWEGTVWRVVALQEG